MDYEKKYKETLEKAKDFLKRWEGVEEANSFLVLEEVKDIFPELKESEDERIRNILIGWVNLEPSSSFNCGFSREEIIAWLEKQKSVGEIVERCKTSWYNEGKIQGQIEGLSDDEKYQQGWHDALEKQGEKPKEFTYTYESEVGNGNIKGLVTGKVHIPKFHKGDWIVCKELNTAKIIDINDDRYEVEFLDGHKGIPHIDYIDRYFHLWTIEDAKDGDVLTVNGKPFIYCCNEDYKGNYCCIDSDGVFRTSLDFGFNGKTIHPATKEQRELLFKKMRENGYYWNRDTKTIAKY